jgi:hypothetical protein
MAIEFLAPETPRTRGKSFDERTLAEALIASGGFVAQASKLAGCSVRTVQRAIHDSPNLQQLIRDIRLLTFENAAQGIVWRSQHGDHRAQSLVLRYLGPEHNWRLTERREHTGARGGPIAIRIAALPPAMLRDAEIEKLSDRELKVLIAAAEIKRKHASEQEFTADERAISNEAEQIVSKAIAARGPRSEDEFVLSEDEVGSLSEGEIKALDHGREAAEKRDAGAEVGDWEKRMLDEAEVISDRIRSRRAARPTAV